MSFSEHFVLDGSVTLAWIFEDEKSGYAEAVRDRLSLAEAFVPSIWPLEVANGLLVAERRKRLKEETSSRFSDVLGTLPIVADDGYSTKSFSRVLLLARKHSLSSYDASYLEIAIRRGLPLATLDKQLKSAAKSVGVSLYLDPDDPRSSA